MADASLSNAFSLPLYDITLAKHMQSFDGCLHTLF